MGSVIRSTLTTLPKICITFVILSAVKFAGTLLNCSFSIILKPEVFAVTSATVRGAVTVLGAVSAGALVPAVRFARSVFAAFAAAVAIL